MDRGVSGIWSVAGFLTASALATTISGIAAAQSPAPKIFNRSSASSVQNFWTAERMAAAKPKGMEVAGVPKRPAVAPLAPGAAGTAGGSLPGGAPFRPFRFPLKPTAAPVPVDGSYPGPNETFEYFPRYRTYPISTIGKLFFTEPDGSGHYCTASVTTGSASINNIIWTAGHCVAIGGTSTFDSNFLFCPSHDNGNPNPALGCWSWSFATTSSEWFNSGTLARDYAIVGLQSSGTVINADVATVTGGLGFAWNQGRDQHWIHLGYPQDPAPWTGNKLIETAAEHRYDDSAQGSPPTNSWGTSQGHGASGSALLLSFSYASPPLINSNVSYGYTTPPQFGIESQGPYIDTQVCNFWKGNTGYSGSC
jgi:hypothetical protein